MKKYLVFTDISVYGKKTKRWLIHNVSSELLAQIWYHTGWREYVWATVDDEVIFSAGCTKEVLDFLIEHKDDRQ